MIYCNCLQWLDLDCWFSVSRKASLGWHDWRLINTFARGNNWEGDSELRGKLCDKMYIRQSDMLDKLYPVFVVVGKTNDDAVLACVWIGMDSFTIDIAYRRKIGHEISINVQTQKRCYWGDQIGQKVDQGKAPLTCKIHAPYFLWLDCLLSVEMPFSVQFRSRVLLEQRGR